MMKVFHKKLTKLSTALVLINLAFPNETILATETPWDAQDVFFDDTPDKLFADQPTKVENASFNESLDGTSAFILQKSALTSTKPLIRQETGKRIVNSELTADKCFVLAYLNANAYANTKRTSAGQYTYNELGDIDGRTSPETEWLKNTGIISMSPFVGQQGAGKNTEIDYPGFLAYKITPEANGWKHIDIFVTLRGSQGEKFQPLQGNAGASWFSNFDGAHKSIQASELGIPNKFLSEGKEALCFHQGYCNKFLSFRPSLHRKIQKLLIKELKQDSFKILSEQSKGVQALSGQALKDFVDNARKCTFQVYCTGHSQGGGIAQITIADITTQIGEYLYGPNFDNKIFNLTYGIFFSPTRAWGNTYTREVYENVIGVNNMLGYSSVMDIVTNLPLGHNIEKDPSKIVFLKIAKIIVNGVATFFDKAYINIAKLICNCDYGYETLTHWAFEDTVDLLRKYYALNINTIDNFISDVNKGQYVVENKEAYLKQLNRERSTFQQLLNDSKLSGRINQLLTQAQEEYFYAHRQSKFFKETKMRYHSLKATKYLIKAIKSSGGLIPFVSSQHFGSYAVNLYLGKDGKEKAELDSFFQVNLPSYDLQTCVERADTYYTKKEYFINQ
mgnify:CR=1 FL=1